MPADCQTHHQVPAKASDLYQTSQRAARKQHGRARYLAGSYPPQDHERQPFRQGRSNLPGKQISHENLRLEGGDLVAKLRQTLYQSAWKTKITPEAV